MFENRLPADQMASLSPGDLVLIENWPRGWRDPDYATASVARTTATQIVVIRSRRGQDYEERYRKKDGGLVGNEMGRAELVDPTHPRTVRALAQANRGKRAAEIDSLAHQWSRSRDDLDLLRQLQVAIGEYLDAEEPS